MKYRGMMTPIDLFRVWSAVLSLLLIPTFIHAEETCMVTNDWKMFVRGAGLKRTPFAAHNHRTDWSINSETVESVLAGESIQNFPDGSRYMGEPVSHFDLRDHPVFSLYSLRANQGSDSRDEKIAKHLANLVK